MKKNTSREIPAPWFLFFFFFSFLSCCREFSLMCKAFHWVLATLRLDEELACMTHTISWSRPHYALAILKAGLEGKSKLKIFIYKIQERPCS